MQIGEPTADEILALRRCVRDLTAFSALSAYWERSDLAGIAEGLTEALLRGPHVDFVYVRVKGASGETAYEAANTHQGPLPRGRVREIGTALDSQPPFDPSNPPPIRANLLDGEAARLVAIPIGLEGDCGLVLAGSHRLDFPNQLDQLLLGVAANQAAIVLQHKRIIQQREQTEQALWASRERLRIALANSDTGTFRWNPNSGVFLDFDANLKRLFGFAPDEPVRVTEDFIARVHADDVPMLVPAVNRCRQGADFEMEYRVVLPDGGVRWLYDRAKMERDAEGRPTYLVGACTDITKRKQVEAALRASEERFRLMANSIPQLAWMARPDGHIYWYNERWFDYTGTTPEQMEGWGWQSVHDPNELPKVLERWKASLVTGQSFDMVFPLRGKDGIFRPFLTRVSPLRDAEDRILHWFGTNTDITEIRTMEAALQDADRRKDEFLATLAHELRNPLAPLRNALQIMKLSGNDPSVANVRDMMERQVQQMIRLVDDLLDLSRISRGKIELRKERLALATVVETARETSRPLLEAAHHELTLALPPQPLLVDGDLIRLAQVVSNLLNNAAKYTPEGGHVWLTVERDDGDALLRVRDNGIGIPADMLPRIFEMFTQVDRTLERAQGGLGIGLTLVRRLVEMHDGTVEAHSDGPGRGSTFSVRLPLAQVNPERPQTEEQHDQGRRESVPGRRRILVVDDNVDSAHSLAMLLQLMGNEVRMAHDGPSALEAAAAFVPDIVLLDIGLPGMNGLDVARRMRKIPALQNAVLVAQTGWGQDEDRRRSQEAGFNTHLVKPIDLAALQAMLATLGKPGTM